MPKSKRCKPYSLTVPKKKGSELKTKLLQDVRSCVDTHKYAYAFSVGNMRNSKLKDVRTLWEGSRFFLGKNRVMAIALGTSPENEYREGLHKLSGYLRGAVGLFLTSEPTEKVVKWFRGYQEIDYARAGNKSTHEVTLPSGPLPQFQHTMEPQLRQLGMPTCMQKGVISLSTDYQVCKEGAVLSPEQCQILKLLAIPMATFHITLLCCWRKEDNSFEDICGGKLELGESPADSEGEPDSQEVEIGSEETDKLED